MPSLTLEVVIGLVFVYVLLSLITSAVTEWIARFTAKRSQTLEAGIRTLLSDPSGTGLAKRLYEHPLIQGLFPDGKKPSYIPSQTFAIALMDLVGAGTALHSGAEPIAQIRDAIAKLPDGDAKAAASELVNALALLTTAAASQPTEAGSGTGTPATSASAPLFEAIGALTQASSGNLDALRKNIENWFDAAMERLSGLYKRWAQIVTFVAGLVVVVALNADSVMISNGLARDPALSAAVVAAAGAASKDPLSNLDVKKIEQEFQQLKLPIGWSRDPSDPRGIPQGWSILTKVAGLLLTALAISLGAPFWFDALNKLVNLRATGDPPPVSKPDSPQPA